MRPLIFIVPAWYPSPEHPGHGIFVEAQAIALSRLFDVAVIAPESIRWRDRPSGPSPRLEVRRGIPVVRVAARPRVPKVPLVAYQSYRQAVERGIDFAAQSLGKPSLLHAHVVLPAGWASLTARRASGLPVVLTEHSAPFSMHLASALQRRLVSATLNGVDELIAVSPGLGQELAIIAPSRDVRVIGNVVDVNVFSPPSEIVPGSPRSNTLLCVGALVRQKRIDLLLAAIAQARAATPPLVLRVVGEGPERGNLEARARELGVLEMVSFVGALPPERVRDEMRAARALVSASDVETFGVVLAEALACGTPVIATSTAGARFVTEPGTGMLVPVGDADALADAIVAVSRGDVTFDTDRCRESAVRRFDARVIADEIAIVYEGVWARRAKAT